MKQWGEDGPRRPQSKMPMAHKENSLRSNSNS